MAGPSEPVWSKCIRKIPTIMYSDVENFVRSVAKVPQNTLTKGYKFFAEAYVHNVEAKTTTEGCLVRADCYHSMRKNAEPHHLQVCLVGGPPTTVTDHQCSCVAGKGVCNHTVGLLYQVAHYELLNLSVVPPGVSKTAQPQQWHIPRACGIHPDDIEKLQMRHVCSRNSSQKRKSVVREEGVRSTLYRTIPTPLKDVSFAKDFVNFLAPYENLQDLQLLSMLPPDIENIELVDSAYGSVPKGSMLSYQQRPQLASCSTDGVDAPFYPNFPLPLLHCTYAHVPTLSELLILDGMCTSLTDSVEIELATRKQSECERWHQLRSDRVTASQFKYVCSRRENFGVLVSRLQCKRQVQKKAMCYGLASEDSAVEQYVTSTACHVYSCGFVVNPSAVHLGCTPDRKVYDPSEEFPFGLLEVKCPQIESFSEAKCLKLINGTTSLKRNHAYYYQIMGQMAITGCAWCDFMVWCINDYHIERVYFDAHIFEEHKMKLDMFYFQHYLPQVVSDAAE